MKWYFRVHTPSMSANAGAIWPVVRHREEWSKIDSRIIAHEEVHLKGQIVIGILALLLCTLIWSPWFLLLFPILSLPWLALYGIFFILGFGYRNNPFEVQAYEVGGGREKYKFLGWIKYIWKKNPTR